MHQSGPNTRKVFHKLLMSFHMQKKLLGAYKVTKSLIKEVFLLLLLGGRVLGGAAKRFGELMASFTTHQTIKSCISPDKGN